MGLNGFKYFENYISNISEKNYDVLQSYFAMLDSLSLSTNQSMFIFDFYKGEIPYFSDLKTVFSDGCAKKEDIESGKCLDVFVSVEGLGISAEVIRAWFRFLDAWPANDRCKFSLRFDCQISSKLMNVTMTPISLCSNGKVWLAVCIVKHSTHTSTGNAKIIKKGASIYWTYDFLSKVWIDKQQVHLSEIEKNILRFSTQGLTEQEISTRIYRSKDGLKSIKRKMYQTMGVSNITEAVSFALLHGLI